MIRIILENVSLTYGPQVLFDKFNGEINNGKITVVTGHNGCGKSTFLRLAAKLLVPDSGSITVTELETGRVLEKAAYRERLAMVTPEFKLYDKLTAKENMDFLLGLRGVSLSTEQCNAILSRVGLNPQQLEELYTGQFSTGMRQRLKLAVLIASQAEVWLLDEPGANLDEAGVAMVIKEARQAALEGRLVLWATNDAREEAAADEIIRLAGH